MVATLADGSSVFVKTALNDLTATWLQNERRSYETLETAPYLPLYIGGDELVLVLEDLSAAHWPPPWRDGDVACVLEALAAIAAIAAPPGLRSLEEGSLLRVWQRVADDPDPFLRLNVCTAAWFDRAMPTLTATDSGHLDGPALVHSDFRSDNLCLLPDRVVVIDWPGAAHGRADFDVTSFAATLPLDGGPQPEQVLPTADGELVAMMAGCSAYYAPQESVPAHIRDHLQAHLRVTLPWAARLLDLPPPDGPGQP
jgi:hypothetical protein